MEKLKTLTNFEWKEMYQFYLKIGKINEKVNTIFIWSMRSDFDLDLMWSNRNVAQWFGIMCMVVTMQRLNVFSCQ